MTSPVPPGSRVAFLGPTGTFTEQALLGEPDLAAGQLVPCGSFADVLFAIEEGDVDYGFIALENAIEGAVNISLDTLIFDVGLFIQREVVLPVEMNLLAAPGTTLDQITTVSSFPHAYAQCRSWLRAHLENAELLAAGSTAGAAQLVAESKDPTMAAIANSRAAEVYGLDTLERDIEDHPENATRFALVARQGIPAPTGHDKTSLVVFQRADVPGSLLSILQEFAVRRINLSLLLSRPTRTALGDYCFFFDLDGHIADEVVADCIRSLKEKQADVKFLGSYPAGGKTSSSLRDESRAETEAAAAWLAELRAQIAH